MMFPTISFSNFDLIRFSYRSQKKGKLALGLETIIIFKSRIIHIKLYEQIFVKSEIISLNKCPWFSTGNEQKKII